MSFPSISNLLSSLYCLSYFYFIFNYKSNLFRIFYVLPCTLGRFFTLNAMFWLWITGLWLFYFDFDLFLYSFVSSLRLILYVWFWWAIFIIFPYFSVSRWNMASFQTIFKLGLISGLKLELYSLGAFIKIF